MFSSASLGYLPCHPTSVYLYFCRTFCLLPGLSVSVDAESGSREFSEVWPAITRRHSIFKPISTLRNSRVYEMWCLAVPISTLHQQADPFIQNDVNSVSVRFLNLIYSSLHFGQDRSSRNIHSCLTFSVCFSLCNDNKRNSSLNGENVNWCVETDYTKGALWRCLSSV